MAAIPTGPEAAGDGPGRLVRPYAITRGRTRAGANDLPLETLVQTTPDGRASLPILAWEWRSIAGLCTSPLSIAEISAHLQLPLGVVRVLVTDMSKQGLVQVHRTAQGDLGPDLALLERVLNGIRAL